MSDAAKKRARPPGAPRASDICFSSRWERPLDRHDPHDTFAAARQFHATRIDWNYPSGPAFIRQVKSHGFGYFGTISAELEGATSREGRDKSYRGNVVGNPELNFLAARGDVCSKEYRRIVLKHVSAILDGGADGIYVDDPGMTYHNAVHNQGGFGDASMQEFPKFLEDRMTAAERTEWGLPPMLKQLDYAEYMRRRDGRPPAKLERLFFEFHRQSVDAFYVWLRQEADRRAGRRVPFACNNWSLLKQDEFPFREHFDFWLGETSVRYNRPTPKLIYDKVRRSQSLGKMQFFSPPNDDEGVISTREAYVALTRRIIATSYACGSATLVPWDVWRRGKDTPRFFGTSAEFGDLYAIVAEHRDLYESHEEVFAAGGGVPTTTSPGLPADLLRIVEDPETLFAVVRAAPGDDAAPIVIHLVDWSNDPRPRTLELKNANFGGRFDLPRPMRLIVPGSKPVALVGESREGKTKTTIPALHPTALVVVQPR